MTDSSDFTSLGKSLVFRGLEGRDLEDLHRHGSVRVLEEGDTLLREGQANAELFVVIDGELDVFLAKSDERPTRVHINQLGTGDCVGEYSFIDEHPAAASVAASRRTKVF